MHEAVGALPAYCVDGLVWPGYELTFQQPGPTCPRFQRPSATPQASASKAAMPSHNFNQYNISNIRVHSTAAMASSASISPSCPRSGLLLLTLGEVCNDHRAGECYNIVSCRIPRMHDVPDCRYWLIPLQVCLLLLVQQLLLHQQTPQGGVLLRILVLAGSCCRLTSRDR